MITKPIRSYDEVPATFDIAYASRLVGLSTWHLRLLCRQGSFPAYKVGKGWRIDKDKFAEWKDKQLKEGCN